MNKYINLINLRKKNGLVQSEIADYLNVSRVAYCHYETGRRKPPVSVLIELSKLYNVSIDYLVSNTKRKAKKL